MNSPSEPSAPEEQSGERTDTESLKAAFAGAELSRHVALFYRSRTEQFAAVTAYVDRGLQRGECVLYVADDNDPETVRERFREAGIAVERLEREGQLSVVDAGEAYVGNPFDPVESVEHFREFAVAAAEDGYGGVRVAGENTWAFGLDCEFETVMEFETNFDDRIGEMSATALCQYSLDQFDENEIGKALQTHEQIVYRGELCENPYYVPPSEAMERGTPLSNATLLLEQTRDVDRFRDDVQSREQRLSVVNRVLRHNLRNDVNVIRGRLEWIERAGAVEENPELATQVETVKERADRLVALSEKARHVERTLASTGNETVRLEEAVRDVVERVERDADATFELNGEDAGDVHADSAVETALEELLGIAADRLDDATVTITVDRGESRVTETVRVTADQRFLPETASDALTAGTEEALRHADGLGFWVVNWVVDSVNGSMRVESDRDGERVVLTVPVFEA